MHSQDEFDDSGVTSQARENGEVNHCFGLEDLAAFSTAEKEIFALRPRKAKIAVLTVASSGGVSLSHNCMYGRAAQHASHGIAAVAHRGSPRV